MSSELYSPAGPGEHLQRMMQDWYYTPSGPPPGGAAAWDAQPNRIVRVQLDEDWYDCEDSTGHVLILDDKDGKPKPQWQVNLRDPLGIKTGSPLYDVLEGYMPKGVCFWAIETYDGLSPPADGSNCQGPYYEPLPFGVCCEESSSSPSSSSPSSSSPSSSSPSSSSPSTSTIMQGTLTADCDPSTETASFSGAYPVDGKTAPDTLPTSATNTGWLGKSGATITIGLRPGDTPTWYVISIAPAYVSQQVDVGQQVSGLTLQQNLQTITFLANPDSVSTAADGWATWATGTDCP